MTTQTIKYLFRLCKHKNNFCAFRHKSHTGFEMCKLASHALSHVSYLMAYESFCFGPLCNSPGAEIGEIRSVYCVCVSAGRPVMIVVEYMENGSLDSFLRVSVEVIRERQHFSICFWHQVVFILEMNTWQIC